MGAGGLLHLLAPGLLGPVPAQLRDAIARQGAFPVSERLLAQARRCAERVPPMLSPWPESFAGAGALGVLGAGGDPGDGYWYCADPVHLRPDRDRLMVFAGERARLDAEEARGVAAAFNDLFAEDGLALTVLGDALFLHVSEPDDGIGLRPTREVSGRYIDAFLPEGEAGREWRRLLNETQMLLHGLSLNTERESRGCLSVNGLWFWGGGHAPEPGRTADITRVITPDPVLAGLARQAGADIGDGVARLSQMPTRGEEIAVHWPDADAALTAGDVEGWLTALQHFEQAWAEEAASALAGGDWAEIRLYSGGSRGFRLTPGMRRRFWRRPRPLATWLETT